ncbi:MAG TPA: amino acid adenylation domain-containing protein, partial [Herpetosiphonaceae bacterium]
GTRDEFVLLLSVHHIVFDGWSIMVFIRELATLYTALAGDRSGASETLSDLPIQYADFASWQRQPQQVAALERELDYWRQQLADIPTALNLPTDRPRPAVYSSRGATLSFKIELELAAELRALSGRESATLFTLLLAAFQVLLQRYTDQDDIVVGSPIANRDRAELEPLIGLLINTLVLRADLSNNPTFREALARVRTTVNDAFSNQNVPFEHLVAELQPVRDMSRNPLFQVLFVMQTTTLDTLTLPGLEIQRMQLNSGTSKFDLTLGLEETEQSIAGVIEYNTDLFDAETIARLAEHFQTLLGGIVADPDRRIADLPLVTDAECRQQVVDWNATAAAFPHDRCIHELIEAQAERTPDAIAVVFGQDALSYRDLNERSNQLAHHLRSGGIRPESRVGICVERSLHLMIGLLGILKAGGAYVPLDPAYPAERLQYMAQDAQLAVVLTQTHLRERLPEIDARIICLDGDWPTISSQPAINPASAVTPDNMVYMIYTSGSTGQPKGAAVHQRGLVNLVSWYVDRFDMTADDRVLMMTSLSFDLTQKNLFAPLTVGGRLALIPSEQFDPTPILETIQREQITILNCTPSAIYPLVEQSAPEFAALASVRYLFLGGEPIAVGRLAPWLDAPGCQVTIVNTYGPTECSDVTTFHQLDSRQRDATVPIGRPVQNTTQYILDQHLNLLPVGASGELCIGGVGVGLGYVNDARLTAAKFLPDPFSRTPGARLYRTGDLARFQPDGTIDFLGRIDHQVKLRGFRIELGDIEAALAQHPAVEQAIVVVREDAADVKRLVAYVVENREPRTKNQEPNEEQTNKRTNEQRTKNKAPQDVYQGSTDSPSPVATEADASRGSGKGSRAQRDGVRATTEGLPSNLRQFLQERLPEHMIPSAFVVLDEVPLTPSG